MDEFVRVADAMQSAPVTSKAVRDFLRVFRSGASDELPDKQGRVTIPAAAARVRRPRPATCTVIGAASRLEVWDTAAWTAYLETTEQAFAEQAEEVIPGLPLTRTDHLPTATHRPLGQVSTRSASRRTSPVPGRTPERLARTGRQGPPAAPPRPRPPHAPPDRRTPR